MVFVVEEKGLVFAFTLMNIEFLGRRAVLDDDDTQVLLKHSLFAFVVMGPDMAAFRCNVVRWSRIENSENEIHTHIIEKWRHHACIALAIF